MGLIQARDPSNHGRLRHLDYFSSRTSPLFPPRFSGSCRDPGIQQTLPIPPWKGLPSYDSVSPEVRVLGISWPRGASGFSIGPANLTLHPFPSPGRQACEEAQGGGSHHSRCLHPVPPGTVQGSGLPDACKPALPIWKSDVNLRAATRMAHSRKGSGISGLSTETDGERSHSPSVSTFPRRSCPCPGGSTGTHLRGNTAMGPPPGGD